MLLLLSGLKSKDENMKIIVQRKKGPLIQIKEGVSMVDYYLEEDAERWAKCRECKLETCLESYVECSLASDSVRTCPRCSGSGRVEDVCNHLAFTKECELCDGVGKIPTESDSKMIQT